MIAFLFWALLAAQAPSNMAPIDVHYQALPAFGVYAACFSDRFSADPRSGSDDPAQLRQANADALTACRQVRDEQLARALREVTDYRLHGGSQARTHAAVRAAFERYGTDLIVESVAKLPEQPDAASGSPRPADSAAAPAPAAEEGMLVRNPILSAGAGPVPYYHIPPLIAPAMETYLHCLLDSRGVERRSSGGARRRPTVPEGTDCSSRRERAARNANRILRDRRLGTSTERAALVEATLENVERFVDTPPPDWLAPPDDKPGDTTAVGNHAPN